MLKPIDQSQSRLPDPDKNTGRDIVIWDGQCNFCRSLVMRLFRLDWTSRLAFISLHDQRVAERYPELSFDALMDQMWVVTKEGGRYGGADAVGYLSLRMPALWLLAPLMHLPWSQPLWRAMHRWVARRRYRLAGKNCEGGTCHLHK
ncbi:MAG: DUF393 domain-containing protein [Pirellulaceae bacterium]|nr:DUF393 domain-containing protein [Pirellulaceae bacterium]